MLSQGTLRIHFSNVQSTPLHIHFLGVHSLGTTWAKPFLQCSNATMYKWAMWCTCCKNANLKMKKQPYFITSGNSVHHSVGEKNLLHTIKYQLKIIWFQNERLFSLNQKFFIFNVYIVWEIKQKHWSTWLEFYESCEEIEKIPAEFLCCKLQIWYLISRLWPCLEVLPCSKLLPCVSSTIQVIDISSFCPYWTHITANST